MSENIGTLQFTAGAASYTFHIAPIFFAQLEVNGAGIINNSALPPLINVDRNGQLDFNNSSSAGNAAITSYPSLSLGAGLVNFNDSSTAANASISNGGILSFTGSSNAGGAGITNVNVASIISFQDASTAGNSHIVNTSGTLSFSGSSTAGVAIISSFNASSNVTFNDNSNAGTASIFAAQLAFNNSASASGATIINAGQLSFRDSSTAGDAGITNTGTITFANSSTAANATITNTGTLAFQDTSSGGGARLINNAGGVFDFSSSAGSNNDGRISVGSIEGAGTFYLGARLATVGGNNLSTTVSGLITDCFSTAPNCQSGASGGSLVKAGTGTLTLTSSNTYTGGTAIMAGTLQLGNGGTTGSIVGDVINNATLAFDRSNTYQFDGAISGSGGVQQNGTGVTILTAGNSYAGGTTISAGTLQVGNGSTTGSMFGNVIDNGALVFNRSDNVGFAGLISGAGMVKQSGAGALLLNSANTYTGGTFLSAGTLVAGNDGAFGTGTLAMAAGTTLSFLGSGNFTLANAFTISGDPAFAPPAGTRQTLAGVIADGASSGTLDMNGPGTLVLSAANTYTGPTNVNAGTLEVDGSIAHSSLTSVNAGAMLTGSGTVGTTQVNAGGTLAPGSASNPTGTLTITGNLAFQSGAVYLMQVEPSGAASTAVAGTATLDGATANAVFANGNYWINKTSTILAASGGVRGTFGPLVNTNLPANFTSSLSYDANNVYLNLSLNYTPGPGPGSAPPNFGGGLSGNQQAVANALTNSFNSNGGIPMIYGMLSAAGLTQASGELGTGSQQTTFDAMGLFMGLLTDPFMRRNGVPPSASGAAGFAAEERASAYAVRKGTDGFAMFTKAPPRSFEQRWSVWAAGFGGSQSTDGNAVVGSNGTTSRISGAAVGADYLFSPNTLAGFALAGGGTNFSMSGLGSGRSDLFQAGAYVRHVEGPAYVAAALAYGWQDITTDRDVTIAGVDHLRAEFNANAYSGRLEGGYRFVAPWTGAVGLTPYAAAQFTRFDLPAYAEQVISGGSAFVLSYAAKSVTDTRTELGLRSDKSFALQDSILTLRSRVAWAHDFNPDRSIAATFQALPGASFVVNGAAQAPDSALTTASAEIRWFNGWSAAATFEGEFSDVTRSCAGKGVLQYSW